MDSRCTSSSHSLVKLFFLVAILTFFACGSGSDKTNNVVIGDPKPQTEDISEVNSTAPQTVVVPPLPKGAVTASFKTDNISFYGYVKNVNTGKGITTIAFENNAAPPLVLRDTYGATMRSLGFDEFDRDLLLVDTKIEDPQFHKYHLYILKNNQWLSVVNPFAIHESHKEAQQNPIFVDPDNPNNMFRYYSVFDIDDTNELEYGWRLHNESILIQNR